MINLLKVNTHNLFIILETLFDMQKTMINKVAKRHLNSLLQEDATYTEDGLYELLKANPFEIPLNGEAAVATIHVSSHDAFIRIVADDTLHFALEEFLYRAKKDGLLVDHQLSVRDARTLPFYPSFELVDRYIISLRSSQRIFANVVREKFPTFFKGVTLDPSEGWRYGFPKTKDGLLDRDLSEVEFLLANGCPEQNIQYGWRVLYCDDF